MHTNIHIIIKAYIFFPVGLDREKDVYFLIFNPFEEFKLLLMSAYNFYD